VTNARLLRCTGCRSALSPSRPHPFHFATVRSSRARIRKVPQERRLPSEVGVVAPAARLHSLRFARSASACTPPTPDRSHKLQPFGPKKIEVLNTTFDRWPTLLNQSYANTDRIVSTICRARKYSYGQPNHLQYPRDQRAFRSTPQNRALVTSDIRSNSRMSDRFRLRFGARRCASASFRYALLSASAPLSRFPTADRSHSPNSFC